MTIPSVVSCGGNDALIFAMVGPKCFRTIYLHVPFVAPFDAVRQTGSGLSRTIEMGLVSLSGRVRNWKDKS